MSQEWDANVCAAALARAAEEQLRFFKEFDAVRDACVTFASAGS